MGTAGTPGQPRGRHPCGRVAIVSFFTLLWILLATYPLGLANPGTAVRYRTDYIMLVYLAAIVLVSRPTYVHWRQIRPGTDTVIEAPAAATYNSPQIPA